uniref:Uncharacterized protein n=1 Tax=Thermococcus sp. IRI48 TaxID=1197734 RepID=L0B8F3_9EURY|nr:hypothetical protein [Thermococcus sp. IRI48]AFZ84235.1 hypothetical protein i48-9 [Thermococcus sp. IRI48]
MVDATLLENIYFALNQADRSPTVRGKVSYLLTAASFLEALVEREKLTGPISVTWREYEDVVSEDKRVYHRRVPKEIKVTTLDTTEEITNFIEERIVSVLIQIAGFPNTALLDKVWELGYKPNGSELGTIQIFSLIEEAKSLLLKLLVALDLANVALVDIATKLEKFSRKTATT